MAIKRSSGLIILDCDDLIIRSADNADGFEVTPGLGDLLERQRGKLRQTVIATLAGQSFKERNAGLKGALEHLGFADSIYYNPDKISSRRKDSGGYEGRLVVKAILNGDQDRGSYRNPNLPKGVSGFRKDLSLVQRDHFSNWSYKRSINRTAVIGNPADVLAAATTSAPVFVVEEGSDWAAAGRVEGLLDYFFDPDIGENPVEVFKDLASQLTWHQHDPVVLRTAVRAPAELAVTEHAGFAVGSHEYVMFRSVRYTAPNLDIELPVKVVYEDDDFSQRTMSGN